MTGETEVARTDRNGGTIAGTEGTIGGTKRRTSKSENSSPARIEGRGRTGDLERTEGPEKTDHREVTSLREIVLKELTGMMISLGVS